MTPSCLVDARATRHVNTVTLSDNMENSLANQYTLGTRAVVASICFGIFLHFLFSLAFRINVRMMELLLCFKCRVLPLYERSLEASNGEQDGESSYRKYNKIVEQNRVIYSIYDSVVRCECIYTKPIQVHMYLHYSN